MYDSHFCNLAFIEGITYFKDYFLQKICSVFAVHDSDFGRWRNEIQGALDEDVGLVGGDIRGDDYDIEIRTVMVMMMTIIWILRMVGGRVLNLWFFLRFF